MIPPLKIHSNCIKCDMCRIICPENAILKVGDNYILESWACSMCNACVKICPVSCIKDKKDNEEEK